MADLHSTALGKYKAQVAELTERIERLEWLLRERDIALATTRAELRAREKHQKYLSERIVELEISSGGRSTTTGG